MSTVAECYFLDVGQGAAQVVHFADDSAIVIDTGRSYPVLGNLLTRRLGVRRIAALVLSHNDDDHVGGMPGLIERFKKAIDRIYFLQDRSPQKMQALRYFSLLRSEAKVGNLPPPIPLIRALEPCWLYPPQEPDQLMGLELLYPNFLQNIDSQATGNANATSGVLLLRCGDRCVLFPGDSEVASWRTIIQQRKGRPIECDVMAIPHHGGHLSTIGEDSSEADWLYSSAIRCRTTIVSVGTSNTYGHPVASHLKSLRNSGSCILCTQITPRCSENLERLRPGVLNQQRHPGRSRPDTTRTDAGNSSDVACAGTVLVQIGPDSIFVQRQEEHRQSIDAKLNTAHDHPLCRER